MSRDDGGVILPRPYGEAFDDDDALADLIAKRLNRMELALLTEDCQPIRCSRKKTRSILCG